MAENKKIEVAEEAVAPKAKKAPSKKVVKEVEAKVEAPKAETKAKKVKDIKPLATKKEKVASEKIIPVVTEAVASALSVKVTPRKARYVLDAVRGLNCLEACEILETVHKDAAPIILKLVRSAMANATNNFNMKEDKLFISSIQASDSIKMKRFLPRAKGSASGLVKRYSNIFITVKEKN